MVTSADKPSKDSGAAPDLAVTAYTPLAPQATSTTDAVQQPGAAWQMLATALMSTVIATQPPAQAAATLASIMKPVLDGWTSTWTEALTYKQRADAMAAELEKCRAGAAATESEMQKKWHEAESQWQQRLEEAEKRHYNRIQELEAAHAQKIAALQNTIKDLEEKVSKAGENLRSALSKNRSLEDEVTKLNSQIRDAIARKETLERQLTRIPTRRFMT